MGLNAVLGGKMIPIRPVIIANVKGTGKNDCPALKRKAKFSGNMQVKRAALAAPVVSYAQLALQRVGHSDGLVHY